MKFLDDESNINTVSIAIPKTKEGYSEVIFSYIPALSSRQNHYTNFMNILVNVRSE